MTNYIDCKNCDTTGCERDFNKCECGYNHEACDDYCEGLDPTCWCYCLSDIDSVCTRCKGEGYYEQKKI